MNTSNRENSRNVKNVRNVLNVVSERLNGGNYIQNLNSDGSVTTMNHSKDVRLILLQAVKLKSST